MPDTPPTSWRSKLIGWLGWAAFAISWLVYALGGFQGPPPGPPPMQVQPVEQPAIVGDVPPGFATGWVFDAEAVATNLDQAKTLHFANTDAGRAVTGDEDRFLFRAVRKVAGLEPSKYPNINQGDVGSCVGAGTKHGADVCQATSILSGNRATWKPVSAEVIYAGSRVEIGGGRLRGDGSLGRWAMDFLRKYGLVPMEKIGQHDLTTYSADRARSWGRTGVPDDLEPLAREHPIKNTALVKSWTDVLRAIEQDYPVVVCSDQGFSMTRDKDGFCSPRGSWAHCMVIIGVRGGQRPGGFILNSWGDRAHTGPVWPEDAPPAGFWADASVIDRMVRQGDSFALSDVQGFPKRRLNWDVRLLQPRNPLAISLREFALAP